MPLRWTKTAIVPGPPTSSSSSAERGRSLLVSSDGFCRWLRSAIPSATWAASLPITLMPLSKQSWIKREQKTLQGTGDTCRITTRRGLQAVSGNRNVLGSPRLLLSTRLDARSSQPPRRQRLPFPLLLSPHLYLTALHRLHLRALFLSPYCHRSHSSPCHCPLASER